MGRLKFLLGCKIELELTRNVGVYSRLIIMCISTQWGFVLFYFDLFENNY